MAKCLLCSRSCAESGGTEKSTVHVLPSMNLWTDLQTDHMESDGMGRAGWSRLVWSLDFDQVHWVIFLLLGFSITAQMAGKELPFNSDYFSHKNYTHVLYLR